MADPRMLQHKAKVFSEVDNLAFMAFLADQDGDIEETILLLNMAAETEDKIYVDALNDFLRKQEKDDLPIEW